MIAIDTNVLLRYLLWDDEEQSAKAEKLINNHGLVLVSDTVLVETLWTLGGIFHKPVDRLKTFRKSKNFIFFQISLIMKNADVRTHQMTEYDALHA